MKESLISEISQRIIDYAETNALEPIRKPPAAEPIQIDGDALFDEETFVLVISDLQAGHRTHSFNFEVLKERMYNLVKRTIRITALHRRSHPVRHLEVFLLGDLIHGERVGKTVNLDELEDVVKVQLFDVVIPLLEWALEELARNFETVNVRCVRGNHGKVSKFNATTTNWDDIAYYFLRSRFRDFDNMQIHIAPNFYQMVDILGWKFLIAHGDQIPMYLNIPIYGLTNRAMRWQKSIGTFDVLVVGHFHSFATFDWNQDLIVINGTFVTDDDWVTKTLGLSGSCCQTLMSIHENKGVTFVRKVQLT